MARHRSFSSEFKRQISREFLEGRAGMHELARRYSLSRNLIRLWVRKYEAGEFTDELAEAVRIAEYERKIAELERKVGQLTMEVDLLKKGARLARPGSDASWPHSALTHEKTQFADFERSTAVIDASCHCGSVRLKVNQAPQEVTDCNCSICRRYGALWAYYSPGDVQVTGGATDVYLWGRKTNEFHRCRHCGCVTHWSKADKTGEHMGVNARLLAPEVLARARVRHLDGADTWRYLDE